MALQDLLVQLLYGDDTSCILMMALLLNAFSPSSPPPLYMLNFLEVFNEVLADLR